MSARFATFQEKIILEHLLFVCPASKVFWNDFRLFWYDVMKEDITLSLKDVIVGIHVLLNYCISVRKSLICHCRRNNTKTYHFLL